MDRWQTWTALAFALASVGLALPTDAAGQDNFGGNPNDLTVVAEPVAGGVRYLRSLSPGLSVGAMLTAGPRYAVVLTGKSDDVRTWATIYPVLAYITPGGLQISVSPIGGAVVVGNDFGVRYPSGQVDLERFSR